jgi:hypothetical protein
MGKDRDGLVTPSRVRYVSIIKGIVLRSPKYERSYRYKLNAVRRRSDPAA